MTESKADISISYQEPTLPQNSPYIDKGGPIRFNALSPFIYSGELTNGAATALPKRWTSQRDGAGLYTVTHDLNTTDYIVVANSFATGFNRDYTIVICSRGADSFQLNSVLGGSNGDANIFFILIRIQ